MIAPLERLATNPLIRPSDISFVRASGTFNPGVTVDRARDKVVLLVRVFEEASRRSLLGLALSADGERIDEIWDRPAVARDAPYEHWGVEDARITYLTDEKLRHLPIPDTRATARECASSPPTICSRRPAKRHGPRIAGENKNCVIFPEKVDGKYVILHRPMPRVVCIKVAKLEKAWPVDGVTLLGPRPGTWRSSRVGAGAPPIRTEIGWLFPFHGATTIDEGNVYSMGWCVLDLKNPEKVLYVSDAPALTPEAPYEIERNEIPQVDMANFKTGRARRFSAGIRRAGREFLVYYGAADVTVAAARVNKRELIASLGEAIKLKQGGVPL
jgi:predicted GH43/DUF377 family glycosyl hydrolase